MTRRSSRIPASQAPYRRFAIGVLVLALLIALFAGDSDDAARAPPAAAGRPDPVGTPSPVAAAPAAAGPAEDDADNPADQPADPQTQAPSPGKPPSPTGQKPTERQISDAIEASRLRSGGVVQGD